MSFNFYLCRTREEVGPINDWPTMHAEQLGSVEYLKKELGVMFPALQWKRSGDAWLGLGTDNDKSLYIEIWLREDESGKVRFIVMNKAAPSTMRKIMNALRLNHVSAPESGDLVDPYAYEDADKYYAKKKWGGT